MSTECLPFGLIYRVNQRNTCHSRVRFMSVFFAVISSESRYKVTKKEGRFFWQKQ